MGVLDRFERRLDRLVNGAFARAFKSEVQPVEIAGALQRECDDRAAIVGRERTIVPNTFIVELGPSDHDRLDVYSGPLGAELADLVREHAHEQNYVFVGPVTVAFERADDLDKGVFRVRSEAVQGPLDRDPAGATSPAAPAAAPSVVPPVPAAGPVTTAHLEVAGRTYPLKTVSVIGRGDDADVSLEDLSISRRHASISLSPAPTVTDLGSTNGTVVDGHRAAAETALVDGSVITLGNVQATFRVGR